MGTVNHEPISNNFRLEMMNNPGKTKELHIQINDELVQLKGTVFETANSKRNSISKVPRHMYQGKSDDKLFEPQVVSIGPYHHGKPHLKAMEVYKMLYLDQVLKRTEEDTVQNLQSYMEKLRKKEKMARECYAAPVDHIKSDDFIRMLLLDGCFVIEVIRYEHKELRMVNSHPLTDFTLERVKRDLLLLENQLPYFILWDLFFLTRTPWDQGESLISLTTNFFSRINQVMSHRSNADPYLNIKHLLGLQYQAWVPSQVGAISRGKNPTLHRILKVLMSMITLNCCHSKERPRGKTKTLAQLIPSATHLKAAGIEFKRLEPPSGDNYSLFPLKTIRKWVSGIGEKPPRQDVYSLFHVKFEDGVFWIPRLVVNDDMESIFRNLVAYEQSGYKDISSMPVTNYLVLMDCLIDTGADVELLVECGIIFNLLGDHQEVASLFNRVRRSLMLGDFHDFFYNETFKKVEQYYYKRCNRWMANLRQNYFNTPWTFISFCAAVVLLVLTTLQTVYTMK